MILTYLFAYFIEICLYSDIKVKLVFVPVYACSGDSVIMWYDLFNFIHKGNNPKAEKKKTLPAKKQLSFSLALAF